MGQHDAGTYSGGMVGYHEGHGLDERHPHLHRHESSSAGGTGIGNLGVLGLRLVAGGLLAGHGAQKLFGWFGGYGLEGTGGWLESMGFTPGKQWAMLAGASEFGGGVLTALGLLHPLGPIASLGAMATASIDVHGGKPIWAAEGGAELPVINMSIAIALATAGPGALSLDRALGIKVPKGLVALGVLAVAAGIAVAETREKPAATEGGGGEAGPELQDGELQGGEQI
jgi:putative oxidoreductase